MPFKSFNFVNTRVNAQARFQPIKSASAGQLDVIRHKGAMDNPQTDAAQCSFLGAIRDSRRLKARSLELRAATSLARVWGALFEEMSA